MTAGLGTRLRPLTLIRAKAAIPVAGVPLIRHIVAWLVKSDIREPALYAAILATLLGWRAVRALRDRRASARRTAAAG